MSGVKHSHLGENERGTGYECQLDWSLQLTKALLSAISGKESFSLGRAFTAFISTLLAPA